MSFTIGQLATRAGVSVETVRYYERRGLIRRPAKPLRGYRKYGEETLGKLRFVRKAKALGFRLDEIEKLLLLDEKQCEDVRSIAQLKLERVRDKLDDLRRLESALGELVRKCDESTDNTHCPIIEALLKGSQVRE